MVPYAGFESLLVRPALLTHPRRPLLLGPRGGPQGVCAPEVDSSDAVYALVRHLTRCAGDHFVVIALDGEGRVLGIHEQAVAREAPLPPLVRLALRLPCLVWETTGAVVVHVRGGGSYDHSPTDRDARLIRALHRAYRAAGLELVDYVIAACEGMICSVDFRTFQL